MNANPVVHFEMPAIDNERVSKFYHSVFGWQMKDMGSDMGNYIVASTAESDDHGRPKTAGTINGGFYKKGMNGADGTSIVIGVGNIKETMKKIQDAGGAISGEPVDIPGVGKYVSFVDTEGNKVSILEPSM